MQLKRVADFIIRNLISGDTSMFSHADSIGCEQSIANLLDGVLIIDVVDSSVDRDRFILISAALEGKQANERNILRLGTGYGRRCVGRQTGESACSSIFLPSSVMEAGVSPTMRETPMTGSSGSGGI